jgi:hypothetical protein
MSCRRAFPFAVFRRELAPFGRPAAYEHSRSESYRASRCRGSHRMPLDRSAGAIGEIFGRVAYPASSLLGSNSAIFDGVRQLFPRLLPNSCQHRFVPPFPVTTSLLQPATRFIRHLFSLLSTQAAQAV